MASFNTKLNRKATPSSQSQSVELQYSTWHSWIYIDEVYFHSFWHLCQPFTSWKQHIQQPWLQSLKSKFFSIHKKIWFLCHIIFPIPNQSISSFLCMSPDLGYLSRLLTLHKNASSHTHDITRCRCANASWLSCLSLFKLFGVRGPPQFLVIMLRPWGLSLTHSGKKSAKKSHDWKWKNSNNFRAKISKTNKVFLKDSDENETFWGIFKQNRQQVSAIYDLWDFMT